MTHDSIHQEKTTCSFRRALGALCLALIALLAACGGTDGPRTAPPANGRLRVVTTLFPLYDFARSIAGERAQVSMLLPPGMEPHSFEPRPDDMLCINSAGLFVYTNPVMEPWAARIIQGVDPNRVRVINAGRGAGYRTVTPDGDADGHEHGHQHAGALDPHIWLDLDNAQLMVDNILSGFTAADPVNAAYYRSNAFALKSRLTDLDRRYRRGLASCERREFLHGGHYAFGYLARRYNLSYRSLSGVSSESEPSAARMAAMVRHIRESGAQYLFAEELLSPRLTETLAAEAGVRVLRLHGGHNLALGDFRAGVTFVGLMEQNLVNLQKGLACRPK
jgi:zinc transport system substrate-binding protein